MAIFLKEKALQRSRLPEDTMGLQKQQELFVVSERGCHDAAMTYTNSFPNKRLCGTLWQ